MPTDTPVNDNRIERVLAYMVASMIGIGLISVIAIIIGTITKVVFTEGAWPVVLVLPSIAIPLGFVLLIVLLILFAVRRSRASRDADR